MMRYAQKHAALGLTIIAAMSLLSGCMTKDDSAPSVSGGRSGVLAVNLLTNGALTSEYLSRPGALLGVYLTEFLSRGTSILVSSALSGIDAQTALAQSNEPGTQDEDFVLLQAFADALQVNIPELLNTSPDREASLNKYVEALRNVGTRAQERFDELEIALDTVQEKVREQRKVVSQINRELRDAIEEKDFSHAGELNQTLSAEQETLSELELESDKTEQIHDTLEDLIEIYQERLLAIESNRLALLAGVKVVDVPGAEDLDILETPTRRERQEGLDLLLNGGSEDGSLRLGE